MLCPVSCYYISFIFMWLSSFTYIWLPFIFLSWITCWYLWTWFFQLVRFYRSSISIKSVNCCKCVMFSVDTSPNPLHWSCICLLSSCTDTWRIFSWEGGGLAPAVDLPLLNCNRYLLDFRRWTFTGTYRLFLDPGHFCGALHLCTLKLLCLGSFWPLASAQSCSYLNMVALNLNHAF